MDMCPVGTRYDNREKNEGGALQSVETEAKLLVQEILHESRDGARSIQETMSSTIFRLPFPFLGPGCH